MEKSESSPLNERNYDSSNSASSSKLSQKKFSLTDLLNNSSQSPQSNERPLFMMNFLKERYGKEKFDNLVNLIEESENPLDLLKDESQIQSIIGDDYKLAIKFLKYVMNAIQTNQKVLQSLPKSRSESSFN